MALARPLAFLALVCLALLLLPSAVVAQITTGDTGATPGGVYIDTDGMVRHREVEQAGELAAQRLRAKALVQPPANAALTYVSLPRVIEQLRETAAANRPISETLRYLCGLTQVRYVFVFPAEKDLVIAGPSEPIDASLKFQAVGKLTGRPILQLDDLVVALRLGVDQRMKPFGCSIDPRPDALQRSGEVMRQHAKSARAVRMNAMKEALGPQKVSFFGAPPDTRFTFATLLADYRLKRLCLNIDAMPVTGVGSAVDNSRPAGNRFWFEADYAPLLVSAAGDAYEFRGNRLTLKAGAVSFDARGATETAQKFAQHFSERMPQIATVVPAFADLQNIADLALLASLIRHDKLDSKAGVDLSWIFSPDNYKVPTVSTATSVETLVNFTSGSIVAGGVSMNLAPLLSQTQRQRDSDHILDSHRARPSSDNFYLTRSEPAK